MNVSPILESEFSASAMAVPPLARRADLTLDSAENQKLIRHIEAGEVRTLLYGGNANLYHVAVGEYRELLDMLAALTGPATRVIPAIGPDYGKMLDQARILAQTPYRTAMVLPLTFFTTSEGVEAGLTRIADTAGIPLTLYIKSESYVSVDTLARLVDRGTLIAVKYAIVRDDPSRDDYLCRLLQNVSPVKGDFRNGRAAGARTCAAIRSRRMDDGVGLHRAACGDGFAARGEGEKRPMQRQVTTKHSVFTTPPCRSKPCATRSR
jgi:dihydrodipicolinate synthase/N-acetylneuraminate lyase